MNNYKFLPLAFLLFSSCASNNSLDNQIEEIFSEFNDKTPGVSAAIVKNHEVIYQNGFGLANIQENIKIKPETNFRLASITKQFTAFSIMLLENENKLSFDDPIEMYLPNFPVNKSEITIKNILQHTSGILAYEDYMSDTLSVQLKDKDVLQILLEQDSVYFAPGTEHRYSNSGYAILALIIEQVSGKRFSEFLSENIFKPIEMKNSIAYEKGFSKVSNRAYGYEKTDSGFVDSDQSLTSAVLGDGGIYSSTIDLIKWDKSIDEATLLPQEKLNKAFEKTLLPNDEIIEYGLGWRLDPYKDHIRRYHTGSTSGFSNIYMKLPEMDLTIILLMNIKDYDAKKYAEKIADLFIQ